MCTRCRDRAKRWCGDSPMSSGTANGWLAEGGVTHAKDSKLGRQAIQVQADAVEVDIGGASGKCESDRILCRCVLWGGLLQRVQQNSVDVGQFQEPPQEG